MLVASKFGMVEVAVETWVIFPEDNNRSPPVRVIPLTEERPPVVVMFNPPEKVEVPVPRTSKVVVAIN